MVIVIDTSSAKSALALVGDSETLIEDIRDGGRGEDLPARVGRLIDPTRLSAVAVALGPGSFTGVRVGVSFGLGLAMGLGVRLLGLSTLQLAAARAFEPATGLAEAGRGRVYYLPPGGVPGIGGPADVPRDSPAAGWLREGTAAELRAAGLRLLGESELRSFAQAAEAQLSGAQELGYDRVKLEYMSSFRPLLQ